MKISIIGAGYVGLVTGVCFANTGNDVLFLDVDKKKVLRMKKKQVPFYEPELEKLFKKNIELNYLNFTTSLKKTINHSNLIFFCLPTPEAEDGSANLSYIKKIAAEIGKRIKKYTIIINKSTVPVGTNKIVKKIISKETKILFDVVSNPEFLKQGNAINDFLKSERVIIGSQSKKAIEILKKLYLPYVETKENIIIMGETSAELTKYAANSFLATKITFMNEIANYCEKVGADIEQVRTGISSDSRIGRHFLFAGVGYGGSCFPKDVKALIKSGEKDNFDFHIIKEVNKVNENQKLILVEKLKQHFGASLSSKNIAVWGLSFKPETDDTREAPAHYIIKEILALGVANICVFDPEAMKKTKLVFEDKIEYAQSKYECLDNSDALVICTEWSTFKNINFEEIKKRMRSITIFDGRNVCNMIDIKKENITYYSIGRRKIN